MRDYSRIRDLLLAAAVALTVCGCASNNAVYWDRSGASSGGAPATWPCQATD